MTPEEIQQEIERMLAVQRELQNSQLKHSEQIADLVDEGRRVDRRIDQNSRDIRDLLDIVRAQERRIERWERDVEPQGRISYAFDRVYQDIDELEAKTSAANAEMNGKLDAILRRLTGEN
jgi:chromosome segregation ATPase